MSRGVAETVIRRRPVMTAYQVGYYTGKTVKGLFWIAASVLVLGGILIGGMWLFATGIAGAAIVCGIGAKFWLLMGDLLVYLIPPAGDAGVWMIEAGRSYLNYEPHSGGLGAIIVVLVWGVPLLVAAWLLFMATAFTGTLILSAVFYPVGVLLKRRLPDEDTIILSMNASYFAVGIVAAVWTGYYGLTSGVLL